MGGKFILCKIGDKSTCLMNLLWELNELTYKKYLEKSLEHDTFQQFLALAWAQYVAQTRWLCQVHTLTVWLAGVAVSGGKREFLLKG